MRSQRVLPSPSGFLVDKVDHSLQLHRICLREDPVAQVENVARSSSDPAENFSGSLLDKLPTAEKSGRVKVSLDSSFANNFPRFIDWNPPVDATHVASSLANGLQQSGGPNSKVYSWNTGAF